MIGTTGCPASGSRLCYDAAGNLIFDNVTGTGDRTYDAENRMITAAGGGLNKYVYDSDGRRVRRQVGAQQFWQVYGIDGELVAEYEWNGTTASLRKEYGYRDGQLLVIGESPSSGNLALGKTATQSSTGYSSPASRAVDGNTNGNWSNGSVTHTNLEHQPWWEVDVGSVGQIGSVKLWNRTDCCSDRLSNFYVLVSDVPFSSTDLTTTLGQSGVTNYYTAGPVGTMVEVGVNRSGRYVRVQLAGDNYLHLAEVEVLGGGTVVRWLVGDHLGTPRMTADQTGSLSGMRRHDYLPFGEENLAGGAIRSAGNGFQQEGVRQKHTGYERDGETGLDFAQARYYANIQGRFTGPDEPLANQYESDPQSWNLYAYGGNNPLLYTDPTGMWKEIKPGFWQWEEGDTWASLAKILNVDVSSLTKAFPNVNLGPDTILQPGDLSAGPNSQVTDRLPSINEISLLPKTDEDYMNAWLARFGRDDGMVPDPTQMPISRWLFGARMVHYTDLAVEDYAKGFIRFEPGVPGGAIGMAKNSGKTVAQILKSKKGSILTAPLPPGSPTWDSIRSMTWEAVESAAKAGKTGFKTIKKLLSDSRFDK